jgi:hypothetical protein
MSAAAVRRTSDDAQLTTVFAHEVGKGQRVVTRLYGFSGGGDEVRVAAEVYPEAAKTTEPEWFFASFANRELASQFADESLMALECLGCTITQPHPELVNTLLNTLNQAATG